jgi:transketolase
MEEKAKNIRRSIIEMLTKAGSGHLAGPMGSADLDSTLSGKIAKYMGDEPWWEGRDKVVLSAGIMLQRCMRFWRKLDF